MCVNMSMLFGKICNVCLLYGYSKVFPDRGMENGCSKSCFLLQGNEQTFPAVKHLQINLRTTHNDAKDKC